jgi:2-polyprenyl-3-methyl-5-hydroxy-6-metoxy-1,4-benzoquinol methylase
MNTAMNKLDEIALNYHTNEAIPDIHIENLCQEYFITWLKAQIPESARVLELGYGDGLVSAALAALPCDLTLIEGSRVLAERARAKHGSIETVNVLFEDFRPAQGFDIVVASHVLEHVDDPQSLLRLMAPWLNAQGKLVVVVPNRNSIHRQLAVRMGLQPALDTLSGRDLLVGHQRVYSLEGLVDELERAGLQVVDTAGFFLKTLPNSMMLGYSTELLQALNAISPSLPKHLLANIAAVAMRTS